MRGVDAASDDRLFEVMTTIRRWLDAVSTLCTWCDAFGYLKSCCFFPPMFLCLDIYNVAFN